MNRESTIWQGILRILSDGKRHKYAAMADKLGCQVNSIERQVHDLRHGKKPGGAVDIQSAPVAGECYHEAWIDKQPIIIDPTVEWEKILHGYPKDSPERKKGEAQIKCARAKMMQTVQL